MIPYILMFLASLAVLVLASDWFIAAAEKIGLAIGISPFVIGVTIIAFGTSLPELAASLAGIFQGSSSVGIGVVLGSNITNILLVLGLTAIVGKSINLDFDVMQTDMPLLFGSAFMLFFMIQDLHVSNIEAFILLCSLAVFLINSVRSGKDGSQEKTKIEPKSIGMLLVGGVMVYFGAKYTLVAMNTISEMAGVSPYVISLTGVALGTSLPEVVVSIAAARRGQHAIAVGNVLGSNIFNTFAVVGIPSLIANIDIPASTLKFDAPFMVAVTILFGIICISKRISKYEGMMLIIFYVYFIVQMISSGGIL